MPVIALLAGWKYDIIVVPILALLAPFVLRFINRKLMPEDEEG